MGRVQLWPSRVKSSNFLNFQVDSSRVCLSVCLTIFFSKKKFCQFVYDCKRFWREIAACAPLAVREIKRAAAVYLEDGERAAIDEIPVMRQVTANSEDFAEGIASFTERRDAQFKGR